MSFPIQLAASTDSPRLASAEEGLDGRSGHSPSGRGGTCPEPSRLKNARRASSVTLLLLHPTSPSARNHHHPQHR